VKNKEQEKKQTQRQKKQQARRAKFVQPANLFSYKKTAVRKKLQLAVGKRRSCYLTNNTKVVKSF
jgi:hypothetical protein